jgi:hypothetical protein
MELKPQNFENIDIGRDTHLLLTSKFMKADKLAECGDDPYKVMEGPYGEHKFLALESPILEPQFYVIGQEIWPDTANLTRYLIYKCKKSDTHSLPFASTRQEFITHEDTIFVGGAEQLYSLGNNIQLPDQYSYELTSEISNFMPAVYWPEWAQNNQWLYNTF